VYQDCSAYSSLVVHYLATTAGEIGAIFALR
jgi:hypothetical protein